MVNFRLRRKAFPPGEVSLEGEIQWGWGARLTTCGAQLGLRDPQAASELRRLSENRPNIPRAAEHSDYFHAPLFKRAIEDKKLMEAGDGPKPDALQPWIAELAPRA